MVEISQKNDYISVNVSSNGAKGTVQTGNDASRYWAEKSKGYKEIAESLVNGFNATVANGEEEINTAKNGAIALVQAEGNTQYNRIIATGINTKQDVLTAGDGINITDNVISNTQISAEWGNIEGDIEDQEDLINYIKHNTIDTLPIFYPIYYPYNPDSSCWALADTWLDGNVYTYTYNACVQALSGTNPQNLPVKAYGDSSITDYDIVVKQDTMQFKTPAKIQEREFVLAGTYPVVGNGMTMGFTDGTKNYGLVNNPAQTQWSNGFFGIEGVYGTSVPTNYSEYDNAPPRGSMGLTTDPAKSGVEVNLTNTDNSELKLYFKVGNVLQNEQVINIAGVTNALNLKMDKSDIARYPVEVSSSSLMPSWYVVYNDGWIEQGGKVLNTQNNNTVTTFLKPFTNAEYNIQITAEGEPGCGFKNKTATSCTMSVSGGDKNRYWMACGY